MQPTRRTLLIAAASSALLAGCLGNDDDDEVEPDDGTDPDDTASDGGENDSDDSSGDQGGNEGDATVRVEETEDFGEILVGPEGLTLYMFDADEQDAEESTCYDECADNWPPLTVDEASVTGEGVESDIATFERDDGELQVTVNGWPLYYWASDQEPGDTFGQGVNDVWWVLDPRGEPIHEEEESSPGGGGGY